MRGNGTNEYGLPLTVFAFVAAAFALNRMGRRSIERILVDRRVLIALTVAAIGFFCIDATNSPYQRPWNWGREDAVDLARHDAAELVGDTTPVRAPNLVLPLVAERRQVYELGDQPDATAATSHVTRVIVDEVEVDWTTDDWRAFGASMANDQFVLVSDVEGVRVYRRLNS